MRGFAWLVVVALVALVAPRVARAEDEIVRGAVVKVEAKEIYVNLGSERGVSDGAALRIKRTITLHHPVTRAVVEDWIPIGSASVTQAGAVMSRAVIGELIDQVKVGDIAEVLIDRPDPARPATPMPTGPPAPPVDPATAEVLGLFSAQSGQTLATRIAAWEQYLSTHAGSPFADGIRRDLDELHAQREQMRSPTAAQGADTIATVAHNAPKIAAANTALAVVFVLDRPERIASAYLHFRSAGALTYRRVLLAREHDIYLRGAIPADVVQAPGVEYFVEVSTPNGRSGLALGTPAEPIAVEVRRPPLLDAIAAVPGRSSVKLAADYLDFAMLDKRTGLRTDHTVNSTLDFTYRLASEIESLGVGYGVYAGSGGFANRVWTIADPAPSAAFQYGYADIEVGGRVEHIHLSGGAQVIAGVGPNGFGMGGEGRMRIGDRDGTNLSFIGRTIDQVGFLTDIRFATRPAWPLMVGLSVGATNQPNRGDVAVKLGVDAEILTLRNVSLILKTSWQGRSADHGGLGGGGGLGFYW